VGTFLATDSLLIRGLVLCAVLSGIGALCGIAVLVGRRSIYAFPLAIFPAVFPFLYYITHTSLRYRHPIDPVTLLLTAIALEALWQSLSRGRHSQVDATSSP
jgi:ABC-type Fe3+-siderophore transport system permease subunit